MASTTFMLSNNSSAKRKVWIFEIEDENHCLLGTIRGVRHGSGPCLGILGGSSRSFSELENGGEGC